MNAVRSTPTRLARRVGRRGTFLLFITVLDLIYAFGLAFPTERATQTSTYKFLAAVFPLEIWALLWATVGLICFIYALKPEDAPGYAAAMFLKVLWALTFFLGWIFADVERGYLSTAIWGSFAAVIALIATWPDDIRQVHE